MPDPSKLVRVPSLKTVAEFQQHIGSLGINLPSDEQVLSGPDSPLALPVDKVRINGKWIGNRYAVQPMEGWDATTQGHVTDDVRRRWRRFGESGAKLICGGEAMAVCAEGRANPNQLLITAETEGDLRELRQILVQAHVERYGTAEDLVLGFQLTHSGRFCKPRDHARPEPRVAYRHPLLDPKFGINSDDQVMADAELESLVQTYVAAARIAWNARADFVDIKHCHGYLLHELLSAFTRPGPYGGSFENRTRVLQEIVAGIRESGNSIEIGVRLSAFDFVPFRPDPKLSKPGKPGPGIPDQYEGHLPYRFGFGVNQQKPIEWDLNESFQFARLCVRLGVKILNVSAGSPYYNPHIQRPAAYPPSDGYQPPEDPLAGVARQIEAVRQIRTFLDTAGPDGQVAPMVLVGSAYSYLQEYLPHVAQFVVRNGWTDVVGLGRVILSYPQFLTDVLQGREVQSKWICRTFSDCTTAPRNGMISGCYPLDKHYAAKPEATRLKQLKRA